MIKKIEILNVFILLMLLVSVTANAQVGVTADNLNQNADQSQGNYEATNLNYLSGVGSLGMMQSAWKDPLQHMGEGQTRPGYTKYYWTPEVILPVRIREGMYTLINFPSWEVVENVYIGDGNSFNARIEGPSSLMLYPDSSQFVGVDTNMVVFGRSGNKYVFYVQSETVNTDRITNAIIDIEVVGKDKNGRNSKIYGNNRNISDYSNGPDSEDSTYTRSNQKEDWIENIPVDPTKFRFDIEVYVPNPDDIVIAPERVWRDNIFTYIDLGEKALTAVQRPIVTLIVERSETPVGFRSAGPNNRLIIVEGMGDMVLRSGKRLVCLKLRRSDSDGLENAIYAKTNDWDIQNQNPGSSDKDGEEYEDVYGSDKTETNNQYKTNGNNGFFNSNSFFQPMNGNGQNNSNNLSYEDMISSSGKNKQASGNNGNDFFRMNGYANDNGSGYNGMPGMNNKNGSLGMNGNNGMSNSGTTGAEGIAAANGGPNINSIPKVNPIIPNNKNENGKTTQNQTNGEQGKPYGNQVDANVLNTTQDKETPIKDFNPADMSKGQMKNGVEETKGNNKTLGNSDNNSNPILISKSSDLGGRNNAVSAETEALLKEFRENKKIPDSESNNISIELGTDENVNNLEKLWSDISKHYSAAIGKYQPFYSVDTAADGQGKELFHLRVGPVKSLEEGDNICSQLGRNGIFCSVVRIQ